MPDKKRGCRFYALAGLLTAALVVAWAAISLLTPSETPKLDPVRIFGPEVAAKMTAPPREPIRRQENLDLLAQAPKDAPDKKFAEELLKLQEKDGRDNALICYVQAGWLMPDHSESIAPHKELTEDVLKNGWRSPEADALLPLLEACQPALAKIREGAALDSARGIGATDGPGTPVPNLLAAQTSAKMLCVEGRRLESEGRYSEALENYLVALTTGRDFGSEGGAIISHLVGLAIDATALKQIHRLEESGNLGSPDIERIVVRLKRIEETLETLADAVQNEADMTLSVLKPLLEDPVKRRKEFPVLPRSHLPHGGFWDNAVYVVESMADKQKRDDYLGKVYNNYRFRQNPQRIRPDMADIIRLQQEFLAEPWWGNQWEIRKKFDERIAASHPMVQEFHEIRIEAKVRESAIISRLREARLSAALELWKREQGRYPESLDPLAGRYFETALPVDPFSGKPFRYRVAPDASRRHFWSIGPDSEDQDGNLSYDPSNGAISAGDIF
jgi:tetratricopeptide (TPR) repeat protein